MLLKNIKYILLMIVMGKSTGYEFFRELKVGVNSVNEVSWKQSLNRMLRTENFFMILNVDNDVVLTLQRNCFFSYGFKQN